MTAFELSTPERLGRTVVLGYCDIGAAGIRILEGMAPSALDEKSGVMRETGRESLTFSGMGPAEFSGVPPVEVVHFDGDGGAVNDRKSVTLLKLNTAVGEDLSASLALSVVDLLASHESEVGRVIVVAAVQPPKRLKTPSLAVASSSTATAKTATRLPLDTVCTFSCGDSDCGRVGDDDSSTPLMPASLSCLPTLPSAARIVDSFLMVLVRLCMLEGLPLVVLARQGYRTTGAAADVDGTNEAIKDLGRCLAPAVGLEFNAEKACGARRTKGWKGMAPSRGFVPGYI